MTAGPRSFFVPLILLGILALVLAGFGRPVEAQELLSKPTLRIEAAMHLGGIYAASMDGAGRILATAGDDKTVRLWNLPDGKFIRALRVPIGEGPLGKLFALALSPDGTFLAAGGYDAAFPKLDRTGVYIFETASGRMLNWLAEGSNIFTAVAFSPDGTRLVAATGVGELAVWSIPSFKLTRKIRACKRPISGLAFLPDGTFIVSCEDGTVTSYAVSLKRLKRERAAGGKLPSRLAVSPDGSRLAMGYRDTPAVDVIDARTLRRVFAAPTQDVTNGNLWSVAWSRDGRSLYAGGSFFMNDPPKVPILKFGDAGQGQPEIFAAASNSIFSLLAGPDNGLFFIASDPVIGLLRQDGSAVFVNGPATAEMRGKLNQGLLISRDGKQVRFGLGYRDHDPYVVDLDSLSLTSAPQAGAGLVPPDITSLPITNWQDNREPRLAGRLLDLGGSEPTMSRSLSILPGSGGFILGSEYWLHEFSAQGQPIWRKDMPSVIWGVNVSGDGRIAVAALGDGTLRWFRTDNGEELLNFFVSRTDQRWVMWTPSGYYAASPGGEDLIGWHLNRNWNEAADFFPVGRFRERFYRPDIIRLVLTTGTEAEAIRLANQEAERPDTDTNVAVLLPPVVEILNPPAGAAFSTPGINVTYRVRSPSQEKIQSLDILIDGRPLAMRSAEVLSDGDEPATIDVALPARDVELSLIARTAKAASEPARLRLKWTGATPEVFKPKLYAVVVGVSDYADPALKLGYAAKDARDIANAISTQSGRLYQSVEIKLLDDRAATKEAVLDALDWLEGEVTSRDVGMLFLAGHGVTDSKQRFFYLPVDADLERLRTTAISGDDIMETIGRVAGKALMFIDACHSAAGLSATGRRGTADITQVVNELTSAENGVVMFASSTGREVSIEKAEWENGAFTEALLEGLSGKADYSQDGSLSIEEISLWLSNRVKELTDRGQHPVTRRPDTVPDFPLALLK